MDLQMEKQQKEIQDTINNIRSIQEQNAAGNTQAYNQQDVQTMLNNLQKQIIYFKSKCSTYTGTQGNTFRATASRFEEECKKLMQQSKVAQYSSNSYITMLQNNEYLMNKHYDTVRQQQETLMNLENGRVAAELANEEIEIQNDKIKGLSTRSNKIGGGLRKGISLAELIRCNEKKHLLLQSTLITLMLVLTIAAIIVKCTL